MSAEKAKSAATLTIGSRLIIEGARNGELVRLTFTVNDDAALYSPIRFTDFAVPECYNGIDTRIAPTVTSDVSISVSNSCAHVHTEFRGAVPATATTDGYSGDVYCTDCGLKIIDGHVLPALSSADVVFTVGTAVKKPGEIVSIPVSVTGTVPVDGLLIYEWQYDARIMEFVGYTDFGPLVTDSAAGQASVNSRTGVVNLGYADPILVDGIICSAQFRILDNAPDGTYALTCTGLSAADRGPVGSSVTEGAVTVQRWLPGDFNEDGTVDMQDAVHLIGWINFSWVPDLYPMPYNGSKDFNGDGTVSMQDAVYFIGWVNFSYLPDLYVINW